MIFLLKVSRDSESFMFFGKMSHIFGAKKETVSLPYLTEFTLRLVRTLFVILVRTLCVLSRRIVS